MKKGSFSIKWKMFLAFSVTLLLILSGSTYYFLNIYQSDLLLQKKDELAGKAQTVAYSVAFGLNDGNFDLVQNTFTNTKNVKNMKVVAILDETGSLIIEHNPDSLKLDMKGIGGKELIQDLNKKILVSAPAVFNGANKGSVILVYSLDEMNKKIQDVAFMGIGIMTGAAILALAFILFMVAKLTKGIFNLRNTAIKVGSGDLSAKAVVKSKDELGELAGAFNNMVEGIKESSEKIQKASEEAQAQQDYLARNVAIMVDSMSSFAGGDLSRKLNPERDDEIAKVFNAYNQCIDAVNLLNNDANKLTNSAIAGKLNDRANSSNHRGDFKKIVEGMNNTLDAVVNPLKMAANYVDRISKGDIPEKIVDVYNGDFNEIKNNLNTCIDALNELKNEMNTTTELQIAGDMDAFANEVKFRGAYNSLIKGFNEGMRIHVNNINKMLDNLKAYSDGDLSSEMPKLPGKQIIVTNVVNQLRSNVIQLVEDTKTLANSAIEGNLSKRADITKHQGDFRKIVEGVNNTLDSIISPLSTTATYIDKIAKGDIPEKIDQAYKGDFNTLIQNLNVLIDAMNNKINVAKNISEGNLNVDIFVASDEDILAKSMIAMRESLNNLTKDVNFIASNAISGKLEVRANSKNYKGDFRKVIDGINLTLDAFTTPLNDVIDVLVKIGNGNLTKISSTYEGDFQKIKDSVNKVIDFLKSLIKDQNEAAQSAVNGNLGHRINIANYPGEWGVVINGFNDSLDAVVNPMRLIAAFVDRIAKGDIPNIISEQWNGELELIKNDINMMIKAINLMSEDARYLALAAVEGNLDKRADIFKHNGDFKEIIKGFNEAIDAAIAPTQEALSILKEMAAGDLTNRMTGNFKGDHAALKSSLNGALDSVNELLSQVKGAADQVEQNSVQISDSSTNLSQGATEQAASLEEMTSSMSEVAEQTKKNANNANVANDLAIQARNSSDKGQGVMQHLLTAMNEITESSRNIQKIIKVIDEIAFQTNLLALNAAVEAARAGVHGQGFAVVAEEVRNLAARSANAAKETADMIEQSIKTINKGAQLSETTQTALNEIRTNSTKVADIISEIAVASNEQAMGISQINLGLNQIDKVTQQNTASAEESATSSEVLSMQAKKLKDLLSNFRINMIADNGIQNFTHKTPTIKDRETKRLSSNHDFEDDLRIDLGDNDLGRY